MQTPETEDPQTFLFLSSVSSRVYVSSRVCVSSRVYVFSQMQYYFNKGRAMHSIAI
jgi:hypothetical protein